LTLGPQSLLSLLLLLCLLRSELALSLVLSPCGSFSLVVLSDGGQAWGRAHRTSRFALTAHAFHGVVHVVVPGFLDSGKRTLETRSCMLTARRARGELRGQSLLAALGRLGLINE
jgi:hypothetical protein